MRGESPAPDDQRCPPQILDGCPLSFLFILSSATSADPLSILPHAQVPVGGGDAFAPVAGGPGQFRSVQSAEEAGDLILGPAELEWNEQLGAGQPDNTDPLPENAAAPDAPRTASDSLYVPAALNCHLREYQRDGVAFALALKEMGRKGCLIADEMGLGKTLQALAVCKYLMEETETPLRVCVISPGYLRANWATEINKWGILRPDVDRAETMIKLTDRPSDVQNLEGQTCSITLASYRWMRENKDYLAGYDLVVFDECHLLKNGYHTRDRDCSLRYLAARDLVPTVGFTLMLTGTPTPNAPKELFSLLHLTGSLGGMKWAEYAFRYSKRYFSTMFFGWNDDGTSAEEELQQLQEFSCIRRLGKDYLSGLPDEMRSFVTLPLHTGKAKLNKLAKERTALLNKLQSGALTDNERSKYSRQMQFNRTAALVASAQAKNKSFKQYFRQYVQDHPFEGGAPPFIVFAYHEETILALQEMFEEIGVEFGTVYGKTNKQHASETISLFQQGQVNVLILSLAMSAGLNLQRASTAFFAEVTWSPGVLAQAEKRIHRQGSEHARVHYVYLFGEKPAICADVYKKTRDKESKIRKSVRNEGAAKGGASKKRRV